mmetsp:Transcript_36773/g.87369  ORF Transcript_36773/g.87369 Transcript_36773/m.87369 type:complete len:284 (+) Transcript_36773:761-1612(+)
MAWTPRGLRPLRCSTQCCPGSRRAATPSPPSRSSSTTPARTTSASGETSPDELTRTHQEGRALRRCRSPSPPAAAPVPSVVPPAAREGRRNLRGEAMPPRSGSASLAREQRRRGRGRCSQGERVMGLRPYGARSRASDVSSARVPAHSRMSLRRERHSPASLAGAPRSSRAASAIFSATALAAEAMHRCSGPAPPAASAPSPAAASGPLSLSSAARSAPSALDAPPASAASPSRTAHARQPTHHIFPSRFLTSGCMHLGQCIPSRTQPASIFSARAWEGSLSP